MLSRIRNATSGRHLRVDVPLSRLKVEIARILQSEGYVQGFKIVEVPGRRGTQPRKMIRIVLKYGPAGQRVLSGLERVSRPGRRVYFARDKAPAGAGRTGNEHSHHVEGRHDRPRRRQGGRGRRGAVQCVVGR